MKIAKNILISKKILLERKLRTILSLSGIIVGVSAVIVMVALGKGTEEKVTSQITKMGSNLLLVNAGQVRIISGRARQTKIVTTLELKDADSIAEGLSGAQYVAPAQLKKMKVKFGNLSTNTSVIGTTPDIVAIQNHSLLKGRFFDEDEDKGLRRVAVMGETVVKNIFENQDPIGETILIDKVPFEIIGIFSPKGLDLYGADQDDRIFVPVRTALRRLFNLDYINTIYVKVKNEKLMDRAAKEIDSLLLDRHHIKEGKERDFTILDQDSILEAQKESSKTFTLLIGSIAGLSLLVGGIGVLAVMLISIRERIKEIGIRRAVGAKRRDILIQFLSEALLLSIGGGMIGVVLGVVVSILTAIFAKLPLIIPMDAVGVSFLATVIIGVFFGVYPARKASLLDPIKALQFE
ncbi:MAG: peptide ABC transporter permease [Candidatus Omnitrophica bacterium CG_4_10_14_0_2_um_filter_44_9]|nr:MAG: peptide ABC transporter permease [Candidatus Omnitrophica bacterium CG_4_10_14_0_8_um_filter_44_12]PIZ84234.1 MAG: peptide ABC transporter permease [Candidatus Omnitrophica bacterium CG_4_10_14_0_2_um_filter_44_9]